MNVFFAVDELPKSIFLAGPTPRSEDIESWRHEALDILNELDFRGIVYVPESFDWKQRDNYEGQVQWEWDALNRSSTIVFWIPRELTTLPGFTTNVEFGLMAASSKCMLGYPEYAPKCGYLKELAGRHAVPVFHDLEEMLTAAVARP